MVYAVTSINGQNWLAQNLNYGTRIAGSLHQDSNSIPEKYCYGDLEANCTLYGGLYQWKEAVSWASSARVGNIQGLCLNGWHLPSQTEYSSLFTFAGGTGNSGTALKSTTGWSSGNGADNFSFNLMPTGDRAYSGGFEKLGSSGYAWTSSYNSALGTNIEASSANTSVVFSDNNTLYGLPIRCIQD